jgi:protein phosphatase
MLIAAVLVLLLALAGLAVGRHIIHNSYYVSAHDGTVSIMRGVEGSLLGLALQQPYLLGCLNDRNELSQISYDQSGEHPGCQLMRLQDLRPSERAQVAAGLPAGSLDEAIQQLRELARNSLLPLCAPAPVTPPATSAPAPPRPAATPRPSTPPRPPAVPTSAKPQSPASATSPAAPPTTPSPTVTALPAPPPQPGTDCRTAA